MYDRISYIVCYFKGIFCSIIQSSQQRIFTEFLLAFFTVLEILYGESVLSLAWDAKDLSSPYSARYILCDFGHWVLVIAFCYKQVRGKQRLLTSHWLVTALTPWLSYKIVFEMYVTIYLGNFEKKPTPNPNPVVINLGLRYLQSTLYSTVLRASIWVSVGGMIGSSPEIICPWLLLHGIPIIREPYAAFDS